jgi:hypothetical protein
MKRKPEIDMNKIAKALGAERRGAVRAEGGHFGAMQLVAEVQARFKTPAGGGRGTDPAWTEKRLLPLTPETLNRLEHLAGAIGKQGVNISPLQVAALLLEHAIDDVDDEDAAELARRAAG